MFWDLGHLDGKPYPLGGTSVVMLPASVLQTFADADVQAKVAFLMPMGTLAVVRYYDPNGNEVLPGEVEYVL